MAFGAGKVDAKELIGLSKEELEAKVKEINDGAAKLTALEAENTALKNDVGTIKASLAALEGRSTTTTTPTQPDPITVDPPYNWGEDADKAFNYRAGPILKETLETKAIIVFDRVMKELGSKNPIYYKLESEVRAFIDKECGNNLVVKAAENVVRNAFKIVYADKIEEITRDQNAKSGKFFTEPGTNQSVDATATTDPNKVLSPSELATAAKFGMTPEAYLKSKQSMTIIH